MPTNPTHLCHACGQTWCIDAICVTNTKPPTICPCCGTPTLHRIRSSFLSLTAPCFAHADPKLVSLLYEVWATNRTQEQRDHPSFVTYLNAQLNSK